MCNLIIPIAQLALWRVREMGCNTTMPNVQYQDPSAHLALWGVRKLGSNTTMPNVQSLYPNNTSIVNFFINHTMPFMRWNTFCEQIDVDPQLGYLRLQRIPILHSQCHLCKWRMPFIQTMPIMHSTQCHLCTQCQLCGQCHLCMLHNANYASGAHLALLHIWHCEWHSVMLYYASGQIHAQAQSVSRQ